ncbi:MAG: Holliday junction branch migration protein RuvA [Cyanobacteria bacterium RI_101]|nr:Holliday junction branch migration protein RuvA [Cyanobacteria bacterium RI_101]
MIQFLKGAYETCGPTPQGRWLLILDVNGVGYEIQIAKRWGADLQTQKPSSLQVFVQLQIREENPRLYGFSSQAERELFGQLVAVTGVGAQLALALLDTLGLEGLIQAVITGNLNQLCKTPGVGKKSAERLALELKDKLSQWRAVLNLAPGAEGVSLPPNLLEEVELTLVALGYSEMEINGALSYLAQQGDYQNSADPETWIRGAVVWLSRS